ASLGLAPPLAEQAAGPGARGCRLAGAPRAGDQEVRQVPRLRVGLEALDDLLLPDPLVQALRSILLDPEFLHRRPNTRHIWRTCNKPLAGGEPKLLDDDVQGDRDRRDRVNQRRRRTPGEQQADRVPRIVEY